MDRSKFKISELTDETRIRGFLLSDRYYAAYALGDLESPSSNHAYWHCASLDGNIEALTLLYTGLEPPVLFLMGAPDALRDLLLHIITPSLVAFAISTNLINVLQVKFRHTHVHAMFRMAVTPDRFTALTYGSLPSKRCIRLKGNHLPLIHRFVKYTSAADGRDILDVAFADEMVRTGNYWGVIHMGELIAMGGTHLIAPGQRLAAVGNVMVHPYYRAQGFGSLVSSAVVGALIRDGIETIVLNVRQDNPAALRLYSRLGFETVCTYMEGFAERKS